MIVDHIFDGGHSWENCANPVDGLFISVPVGGRGLNDEHQNSLSPNFCPGTRSSSGKVLEIHSGELLTTDENGKCHCFASMRVREQW